MKLKNIIRFKDKFRLKLFLSNSKTSKRNYKSKIDLSKNQAYFFLSADYGNLGDVAISYAQSKFVEENSDFQVIEIPVSATIDGLIFVKKNIKKDDIILLVGGGNMGNKYDQIEYIRQLVIKSFPNNRIISFPQTIHFSDIKGKNRAIKRICKTYNGHGDLILTARDNSSYKLMQSLFINTKILYTPDIVLSLKLDSFNFVRQGVVICLRNDSEKNLTKKEQDYIITCAKHNFSNVSYYDTHINKNKLSLPERISELEKIWNSFRRAELVITDRLHGMIFCYITNTPCLVFQNNNHKIKESFDWLKESKIITLIDNFSELVIVNYFSEKFYKGRHVTQSLSNYYNPLINCLTNNQQQ